MDQCGFLSVEGLNKKYNDLTAVDNISFSVQKGEIFGLLGPNGAGKTTTIKMLCGLLKVDSGSIKLNGVSLNSSYNKVKNLIGLCPQDLVFWELLTCYEQLRFVGMSYGMTPGKAEENSSKLLKRLGLWDKKNKLAKTLSGGMQRRLNMALGLVHDPELIILDEPQAGLDPQSRILVRDFIRELAKNKTVILTTHDMDEADRLSDRVAIIDHGRILRIDTPERLKQSTGMGDVIQVKVNGLEAAMAQKVMNKLPSGLTDKKYSDGLFLLGGTDVIELIPAVSNVYKAFELQIEDMTIRKRTLEDAFIAMTGRGLRE